jgi:hypothetical protein
MKPRVVEKKLGRSRAWGTCDSDGFIELDPRQHPKDFLDTAIHELLHYVAPEWGERRVGKSARVIARELWKLRFRRVEGP